MRVTTVLLDIDGTLLDSNDAHAASWHEGLGRVGHAVPLERVRRLIGMGGDNLLEQLGLADDDEPGRTATELKAAAFARMLPELRPFPGARELVLRMREAGLKRVVATSAGGDVARRLLERAGVDDLIDAIADADDAARSKPEPDIVHAALALADSPPDRTVLLGDTPWDLQASTRAGVGMIGLRCGGWDWDEASGVLAVYRDPADLLARWDGSPFSPRR